MGAGASGRAGQGAWLAVAWVLPAVLAGLAGWKGIWGSDSAFSDYLVPLPVAGGVLHVPSFLVLVGVVLGTGRGAGTQRTAGGDAAGPASWLPVALLAGLLVAGLGLVDLERIWLGMTTDVPARLRVERNPLALFVASDAAIGLLRVQAWRAGPRLGWALVAPAAVLTLLLLASPGREEIRHGRAHPGPSRGDEVRFAWSRLDSLAALEPIAREYARAYSPDQSVNAEDVAIHFTTSLEGAQLGQEAGVVATLCLYEDGTPDRWGAGVVDCFDHESFTDRFIAGRIDLEASCPALLAAWPPERARGVERADLEACRAFGRRKAR
ncbi:MAG: hypothetical protein KC616_14370 [Myxococcales bacterium]|nr:hypothetical protein [Myxococcales bacterium]